jgi:DNA-binding NarL/FixJ family response regulator
MQLVEVESDECVLWPYGQAGRTGYGKVKKNGRWLAPHVIALDRRQPKPSPGRTSHAAHTCRNRHCLNYRHLTWKTPKQNQYDRVLDGTHSRGTACVTAKLTEEDVRTIRRLRTNGKTQQEIANMFDITQATVSSILLRKSWSWLED